VVSCPRSSPFGVWSQCFAAAAAQPSNGGDHVRGPSATRPPRTVTVFRARLCGLDGENRPQSILGCHTLRTDNAAPSPSAPSSCASAFMTWPLPGRAADLHRAGADRVTLKDWLAEPLGPFTAQGLHTHPRRGYHSWAVVKGRPDGPGNYPPRCNGGRRGPRRYLGRGDFARHGDGRKVARFGAHRPDGGPGEPVVRAFGTPPGVAKTPTTTRRTPRCSLSNLSMGQRGSTMPPVVHMPHPGDPSNSILAFFLFPSPSLTLPFFRSFCYSLVSYFAPFALTPSPFLVSDAPLFPFLLLLVPFLITTLTCQPFYPTSLSSPTLFFSFFSVSTFSSYR